MSPTVSVVIPHFNRSHLLRAALDSVLRGSPPATEIVVVDDGSSGDEWDKVKSYAAANIIVIQRSDGGKGPSRCRNLGVLASSGEYVIFLDSDDLMAPWCVEQRLQSAGTAPEADFWVFPVLLFQQAPGDDDILWGNMATGGDRAERFAYGAPPWHTSSPLWRKSALASIGGFNETVFYGDDSDLHLRALVSGLGPHTFPAALPDMFVRRSDVPRITNSLSLQLVESRRIRLREGTRFLKSREGTADLCVKWESQYFVEAEYLLFNVDNAGDSIDRVLAEWEGEFAPPLWRRRVARAYFRIGLACRRNAYLVVRIARRVAIALLPKAFFPSTPDVAQPSAASAVMGEIHRRLANA